MVVWADCAKAAAGKTKSKNEVKMGKRRMIFLRENTIQSARIVLLFEKPRSGS